MSTNFELETRPSPNPMPQTDGPPAQAALLRPLESMSRHPVVAVLALALTLGCGVPVILKYCKPVYFANSLVYVSPVFLGTLQEDREHERPYNGYIQQQMLTAARYDVVLSAVQALEKKGIEIRLPGESESKAAETLRKAVEVTHAPDSYQISIGLHSKKSATVAEVVNALTESYVRQSRAEEFYGDSSRVATLTAERDKLKVEFDRIRERRASLGREMPVETADAAGSSTAEKTWAAVRAQLDDARRARIQAEVQLQAMLNDGEALRAMSPVSTPQVAGGDSTAIQHLWERRMTLVTQMADWTPKYPEYRSAQREIQQIDEELNRQAAARAQSISKQTQDAGAMTLSRARLEVKRLQAVENSLEEQVEATRGRVSRLAEENAQARDLTAQIDQLRPRLASLEDRLTFLRLESTSPGFLRVAVPARAPLAPEKDNRRKYLLAIAAIALISALVAAVAVDVLTPAIHSVDDIERIAGFPPLGVILTLNPKSRRFAEEHFTRLINSLEQVIQRAEAKVIVFTSVSPGALDRNIALRVGNALAMRGIRTISVNANSFHAQCDASDDAPRQSWPIVQDSSGSEGQKNRRKSALPVCFEKESQAPLHSPSTFARTLEELTADCDAILLDAPPLLTSADAEYLVSLSSATFLTVEAGVATKNELKRAITITQKLNPAGVGIICHGVTIEQCSRKLKKNFREYEAATRIHADRVQV